SEATFSASRSTQTTLLPVSAKHVPATRPTYPVPITAIRIRCSLRQRKSGHKEGVGRRGPWAADRPAWYEALLAPTSLHGFVRSSRPRSHHAHLLRHA